MPLFKAELILQKTEEDAVIELDFFKIPKGEKLPTITIHVNEETREVARVAEQKYNNVIIHYGPDTAQGTPVVDHEKYCVKILQKAYVSSDHLIDKPTKALVIALIYKEPIFAQKLAGKIMNIFKHAELYQRTQENHDVQD